MTPLRKQEAQQLMIVRAQGLRARLERLGVVSEPVKPMPRPTPDPDARDVLDLAAVDAPAPRRVPNNLRGLQHDPEAAACWDALGGPKRDAGRPHFFRDIIGQVGARHGVSIMEMKSERRNRKAVYARQEAMYLGVALTPLSLPQIGRMLGDRDHTTVLHGIRVFAFRHGLPAARACPMETAQQILSQGVPR